MQTCKWPRLESKKPFYMYQGGHTKFRPKSPPRRRIAFAGVGWRLWYLRCDTIATIVTRWFDYNIFCTILLNIIYSSTCIIVNQKDQIGKSLWIVNQQPTGSFWFVTFYGFIWPRCVFLDTIVTLHYCDTVLWLRSSIWKKRSRNNNSKNFGCLIRDRSF